MIIKIKYQNIYNFKYRALIRLKNISIKNCYNYLIVNKISIRCCYTTQDIMWLEIVFDKPIGHMLLPLAQSSVY